jgi:LmbE family N-acetylglucosaminyl deacetylase
MTDRPRTKPASTLVPPTLLALGAHYDDCAFGIPGIMLKAVRHGYRVVAVALIDDYSNFLPAKGRESALVDGSIGLAGEYGVEMRFLDLAFKSQHVQEMAEARLALARIVAEVRPEVGFILWPHDRHADHGPAARLSETALRHAGTLLDDPTIRPARRIYAYDNGPRHTIGFEPDTYVDVTAEWPDAIAWLGRLMALAHDRPYDPATLDGAVQLKETLARYRGAACSVRYAEAVRTLGAYPQEIL